MTLRHSPLLSDPVCCKRLIFGKIQADWYALNGRASKLDSSVHCLRIYELHVTKLTVPELVDLQTNHLNPATRLEQIEQILLSRIYRNVTDPKGVAVWRLHALWPVPPAGGGFGNNHWDV